MDPRYRNYFGIDHARRAGLLLPCPERGQWRLAELFLDTWQAQPQQPAASTPWKPSHATWAVRPVRLKSQISSALSVKGCAGTSFLRQATRFFAHPIWIASAARDALSATHSSSMRSAFPHAQPCLPGCTRIPPAPSRMWRERSLRVFRSSRTCCRKPATRPPSWVSRILKARSWNTTGITTSASWARLTTTALSSRKASAASIVRQSSTKASTSIRC